MMIRLQRISFLIKKKLTKTGRNWTKILIFDKIGELWDLGRNLHFLMNEKWHFWRQNPLEPNDAELEVT